MVGYYGGRNVSSMREACGTQEASPEEHVGVGEEVLGLTHFRGPIRVKRSGSVKGVEDGKERQTLLA